MLTRSINRNIVECKIYRGQCYFTFTLSINRNIVECKMRFVFIKINSKEVLIETLWNVKHAYNAMFRKM